jgi:hypothetical protein
MDAKRLATGTLAGGLAMFAAGYVIFDLVFASFFAANAGADAAWRETSLQWAIGLGNLILAALITLAIGWSRAASMAEGFKIGAIVGLLVWLGVNFILYGIMDNLNLTATIVDGLLGGVLFGIGGAAISAALGKTSSS